MNDLSSLNLVELLALMEEISVPDPVPYWPQTTAWHNGQAPRTVNAPRGFSPDQRVGMALQRVQAYPAPFLIV